MSEPLYRVRDFLHELPSSFDAHLRFGERAVRMGFLTPERLREGLLEQNRLHAEGQEAALGELLVQRGWLTPEQCGAVVAEATPPECVGKYRLLRVAGRGGMSVVHEAEDSVLKRHVALKILREEEKDDPTLLRRFEREGEIAARLRHPNIIAVHDTGSCDDSRGLRVHYIAFEYVKGTTLADLVTRRAAPRAELLRMLEEIARAVGYAHTQAIYHRDLKPSNILVEEGGRVVLTDFGLAHAESFESRLTLSQAMLGTPAYMAPEQVLGKVRQIDERTDVYALGVILYEILTGGLPFTTKRAERLFDQIVNEEPPPPRKVAPSVERDVELICLKAMEKSRSRRYANGREFAEDLGRYRKGEEIRARAPSLLWRLRKFARRRKGWVWTTGMGLVAAAATGVLLVPRWAGERRARTEEKGRHAREKAAMAQLVGMWSGIVEAKQEFRSGRLLPASRCGAALEERVRVVNGYVGEWPEDPRGYYVRARVHLYLGNVKEAEKDARTALAKSPGFRAAWTLLGMIKLEEYSQRISLVPTKWFEKTKKESVPLLEEAGRAFARGQRSGGEDDERWELPRTREEEVLERVAEAMRLAHIEGQRARACEFLEEHWQKGQFEEYALLRGQLSDNWEEVIVWVCRAIGQARGYFQAYFVRGVANEARKNYEYAIRDYTLVIDLRGDHVGALVNRGNVYMVQKDYANAIRDYARATQLEGDCAQHWRILGGAKAANKDHWGAIVAYTRAIELDGGDAKAYYNRGNARRARGEFAYAILDYSWAIGIKKDFAEAYVNRAIARGAMKDLDGAMDDCNRAIKLNRDLAEAYYQRGLLQATRQNDDDAIADFDTAIRLGKDGAHVFFNRGMAYARKNDLGRAIADFGRAIYFKKDFAEAYYWRGVAKFNKWGATRDERYLESSLDDFDRAIGIKKDYADAHYARGVVNVAKGNRVLALEDFRRALQCAPPDWPRRTEVERQIRELE